VDLVVVVALGPPQRGLADLDPVAVLEPVALHLLAVDLRPVGAAEVGELVAPGELHDLDVAARGARLGLQRHVVRRRASDRAGVPHLDGVLLAVQRVRQLRHPWSSRLRGPVVPPQDDARDGPPRSAPLRGTPYVAARLVTPGGLPPYHATRAHGLPFECTYPERRV
jgi:hypothetical protein